MSAPAALSRTASPAERKVRPSRPAFELQGRLETVVALPVDAVALNGRPVSSCFHVFRGRAFVVRDDEALTADIERTARDYFDQERRLREATMEAFAR